MAASPKFAWSRVFQKKEPQRGFLRLFAGGHPVMLRGEDLTTTLIKYPYEVKNAFMSRVFFYPSGSLIPTNGKSVPRNKELTVALLMGHELASAP